MVYSCLRTVIDLFKSLYYFIAFVEYVSGVYAVTPEASQEGTLHPFKSYADVTLFHYNVPPEVARANWEFAAFMDDPSCVTRDVHIYIQHGSYPVMNIDNASLPENIMMSRTDLHHLVAKTAYQPHDATVFPLNAPLPGSWFVAAFLSDWDQQVTQEGLSVLCHYSLGSVALWTQVLNIATLRPGGSHSILTTDETYTYYKMYIPSGTWSFELQVFNCSVIAGNDTSSTCIKSVGLRARALPIYNPNNTTPILKGQEHVFKEMQPFTESYYYLLVVSEAAVSFRVELLTQECGIHIVGDGPLQLEEALETATIGVRHSNHSITIDWDRIMLPVMKKHTLHHEISAPSKLEHICQPRVQTARITHTENFANQFYVQGKDFYTSWMPITQTIPTVIQFKIMPFLDIGGTLSIQLHMDDTSLNGVTAMHTIHVDACLRKGRYPDYIDDIVICEDDFWMNMSTATETSIAIHKLVPYPEPDTWFIAFQLYCVREGNPVQCMLQDTLVKTDIRTHPCIFPSGKSCGEHGSCQEIHKGLHFFTTCSCTQGYRGWGCVDGSKAKPKSVLVLTAVLLIGSNLFFLPAVFLSLWRGLPTQALVYTSTMISSMLYHACDQDGYSYCITKFEVLQFCDFFCSILSLWVTLIALSGLPPQYMATFHMLGVIIIAVGVQYNRTGLLVFIVPLLLGIAVPLFTWILRCWYKRTCIPLRCWSLALLLPGTLLALLGVILFAFVETEHNYMYVHSAWHAVMGLCLVFLLPRSAHGSDKNSGLPCSDSTEMFTINDVDTGNPVFVVVSDTDSLLPRSGQGQEPQIETSTSSSTQSSDLQT